MECIGQLLKPKILFHFTTNKKNNTPEYPKHKLITTSTELSTIENPNSYQTFPHSLLCSSGWDPI